MVFKEEVFYVDSSSSCCLFDKPLFLLIIIIANYLLQNKSFGYIIFSSFYRI